jgi:dethiobiotin synthetase
MTHGIFITGTDTGVGKTMVTAALTAQWGAAGVDAVPMKPIQTGCEVRHDGWHATDLDCVLLAAALQPPAEERAWMAPYRFVPPCSPHLAAQQADVEISLPHIVSCFRQLATRHRVVLVEGAGGVLVPLGQGHTMLYLMLALQLPVLLVARPGLGTINHTLLSLRELRRAGLHVLGVVFNETTPTCHGAIEADNPRIITELAAPLRTWRIPFTSDARTLAGLNQLPSFQELLP